MKIEKSEAEKAIKKHCSERPDDERCPMADVFKYLEMMDQNGDGTVTMEEVNETYKKGCNNNFTEHEGGPGTGCPPLSEVYEIFDGLDTNNDDKVGKKEGQNAIKDHCSLKPDDVRCPKSEKDWKDMEKFFDAVDANGDGFVTVNEINDFYDKMCGGGPAGSGEHAQLGSKVFGKNE